MSQFVRRTSPRIRGATVLAGVLSVSLAPLAAADATKLRPGEKFNIDIPKTIRTGVRRENAERWVPIKFDGAGSEPKGLPLQRAATRVTVAPTAANQGTIYAAKIGQILKLQRYVKGRNRRFTWVDVYKKGKLVTTRRTRTVMFVIDVLPLPSISVAAGGTAKVSLPARHLDWKVARRSFSAFTAEISRDRNLVVRGVKAGSATLRLEARTGREKFSVTARVSVGNRSLLAFAIAVGETAVISPDDIPAVAKLEGRILRQVDANPPHLVGVVPCGRSENLIVTGRAPGEVRIDARYDATTGKRKDAVQRNVLLQITVDDKSLSKRERVNALYFDGHSSLVSYPFVPLDSFSEFTIEAWVYDWGSTIVSQGRDGEPENSFWLWHDRGKRATGGWESGRGTDIGHPEKPRAREAPRWKHIALTYVRRTSRLYVDGKLVSSRHNVKPPGPLTKARSLHIGCSANRKGRMIRHASGFLKCLRISRVARYRRSSFVPEADWTPSPDDAVYVDAGELEPNGSIADLSPTAKPGRAQGVRSFVLRRGPRETSPKR